MMVHSWAIRTPPVHVIKADSVPSTNLDTILILFRALFLVSFCSNISFLSIRFGWDGGDGGVGEGSQPFHFLSARFSLSVFLWQLRLVIWALRKVEMKVAAPSSLAFCFISFRSLWSSELILSFLPADVRFDSNRSFPFLSDSVPFHSVPFRSSFVLLRSIWIQFVPPLFSSLPVQVSIVPGFVWFRSSYKFVSSHCFKQPNLLLANSVALVFQNWTFVFSSDVFSFCFLPFHSSFPFFMNPFVSFSLVKFSLGRLISGTDQVVLFWWPVACWLARFGSLRICPIRNGLIGIPCDTSQMSLLQIADH